MRIDLYAVLGEEYSCLRSVSGRGTDSCRSEQQQGTARTDDSGMAGGGSENCRMERLMYSYEEGYTTMPDEYIVEHGEAVVIMGRHSAAVLRTKKER